MADTKRSNQQYLDITEQRLVDGHIAAVAHDRSGASNAGVGIGADSVVVLASGVGGADFWLESPLGLSVLT